MKNKSEDNAPAVPAMTELLSLVQALQSELSNQKAEIELQRRELAALRQQTSTMPPATPLKDKATSRRRMLRQLATGAAGIAALGTAVAVSVPTAQAAGALNTELPNTANTTTSLTTNAGYTTAVPLFVVDNPFTGSGGAATPGQQSIAISATSAKSFAIYGATTGSGTAPTGIIGVSGDNGILADPIFANSNAGVVGTSFTSPGTVGLSQNNTGVEGRSKDGYGVKGISDKVHGGAFANTLVAGSGAATVVGAPLRLGIKPTSILPTGLGNFAVNPELKHYAGELVLDQAARPWVCTAGYLAGAISSPPADGYFPSGPVNPLTGANWRLLPGMIFKTVAPTGINLQDNQLHMEGELWVDTTKGALYVCISRGTSNVSLWTSAGFTGTPPLPVFRGTSPIFLTAPDRFISTGVAGGAPIGTPSQTGVVSPGTPKTWNLGGQSGVGGKLIPIEAQAVFGNITAFSEGAFATPYPGGGAIAVYPTGSPTGAASLAFNAGQSLVSNAFTSKLSASGQITFAAQTTATHFLVDIVGYYL